MAKKMISMILATLLMMTSAAFAEGTAHTHAPAEAWERNLEEHWHVCECGEKLEAEAHVLDDVMCTVCGSEIWLYDDGTGDAVNYTEYGDVARSTSFDENGEIIDDYVYRIEYDAEGNKVREEVFWEDFLIEVVEYAMGRDGYIVPTVQTGYDPEGGRSVNEYNDYGSVVRSASYDMEDKLIYEELSQYEYDEEGWIIHTKTVGTYAGGGSFVSEFNQYGDDTLTAFYDADGALESGTRSEYEYDEDGNRVWVKVYELPDDFLRQESLYASEEDEDGLWHYEKTFIYYSVEDGTRSVCEYDKYGNELTETIYGADGEAETVYRSEYEFDEFGNVLMHKRYENDRLCLVRQYEVEDEEDWVRHYEKISIELYEDGSMYIREFDMDGSEISAVLFDANGDPVPED